jgi:hypothetical protein
MRTAGGQHGMTLLIYALYWSHVASSLLIKQRCLSGCAFNSLASGNDVWRPPSGLRPCPVAPRPSRMRVVERCTATLAELDVA